MDKGRNGSIRGALSAGLVLVAACSAPDLSVVGYDFHVSRASVGDGSAENGFEGLYWFEVINAERPCDWRNETDAQPVDDVWLYIENIGGLSVDGPPHPEFLGINLWIGEHIGRAGLRVFSTSGGEVVERDDTRLRLAFDLTHEGYTAGDPMWWELSEPIRVELDLPTCDEKRGARTTDMRPHRLWSHRSRPSC